MAQLHDLTALEQGQAIARRELSALELTEHYLARAERLDEHVGAFAIRTPEIARDHARLADGQRDRVGRSPLHGVAIVGRCALPYGFKRIRLCSRCERLRSDANA